MAKHAAVLRKSLRQSTWNSSREPSPLRGQSCQGGRNVTWIYIARSTEMASVGLPFLATFHWMIRKKTLMMMNWPWNMLCSNCLCLEKAFLQCTRIFISIDFYFLAHGIRLSLEAKKENIMLGQWNCGVRILKPTAILFFTATPLLCLISRCYFIKASGLNWNGSGHKSSRVYTLYNKTYIMRGQWNCGVRILKPTAILFYTIVVPDFQVLLH